MYIRYSQVHTREVYYILITNVCRYKSNNLFAIKLDYSCNAFA